MQILAERSEEAPECAGLGVIQGGTPRFQGSLKIPHMGWNSALGGDRRASLFAGIPEEANFYFVHSFFVSPEGEDADCVAAQCDYGQRFAAAFERENVFATQFHPEKSQKWGLKLLENFSKV